jgi:hypothetical protein
MSTLQTRQCRGDPGEATLAIRQLVCLEIIRGSHFLGAPSKPALTECNVRKA